MCSSGMKLIADALLQDVLPDKDNFIGLIIPGGNAAAEKMANLPEVLNLVKWFYEQQRVIGAISQGPLVLAAAKVHLGKAVTGSPNISEVLKKNFQFRSRRTTIEDGQIVTSQTPGSAIEFSLYLVRLIGGKQKQRQLIKEYRTVNPNLFPFFFFSF